MPSATDPNHTPLRTPADIPEKASPSLAFRQGAMLIRKLADDFGAEYKPHSRALMTREAMKVMALKIRALGVEFDRAAETLESE